jgi:hypothetical protein
MKLSTCTVACGLLLSITGFAQRQQPAAPADNTPSAARSGGIRPYSEVITNKARTNRGLFTIHKVDEKYFFELPDSVLNREILVVNRISRSGAGTRAGFLGYAGDQIGDNVISFERGPNNKIFLRTLSFQEMASDSTAGMYRSVRASNLQPIVASFDVKALGRDSINNSSATVIDVTDYLMGDNDVLFFGSRAKRALGLGQYQRDNSYIIDIKSFPTNVMVKTVKTFIRTPPPVPGQPAAVTSGATGTPATFELSSSMIMLPSRPMQPRYFDPRVGYFATGYTDFDLNPQGIEQVRMVTRWRLEPKPEDVQRYLRGELVEPRKPIIFYIDPNTPKRWIPYLIAGVNDWQVAFEKAGFKNAIYALEAPTTNPDWYIDNAAYSAIVYKPSDVANASGPHVHDPRTGEILESHINWYHNVMNLLRNWYFIQTAAVDPRARNLKFVDSLMGQLIRFVSSHEVGHTLGLRHNFGSSAGVPVENLRNKAWVEANGHTPSIMDYARFNYIAQPEDNITETGLFPRIGEYDKWAIEWGYRWFPEAKSAEAEVPILNKLTLEKMKDRRYWFGTESDPDDPRNQNEDLGDNAMKAGAYGIKNLQRIVEKLPEWTKEPNKGYSSLDELYGQVVSQFTRYMGHAAKNIGGIMTTPKTVEQQGVVVEFVPEARQKEAMQFLQEQLFRTPKWLIDNRITNLTADNPLVTVNTVQDNILGRLISSSTLSKLLRNEAESSNPYTAFEMLTDLKKGIWSELAGRQTIDIYRRNLQKAHVERLIRIIAPDPAPQAATGQQQNPFLQASTLNRNSDVISVSKAQLRQLQSEIRAALPLYKDAASRAHLQDVSDRITQALDPK